MQIIQTIKNVLPHVFWVVIIIGVIIALSKGYSPTDFTRETWGNIYIVISIISGVFLCFKIYKQEIVDRMFLGGALFVFIGTIGYLGNISSVLYYYENYIGVILFASITFIGVVTFFSPAGFIGVLSDDKNKIYNASLKLFAVVIGGLLWSLYASIYLNNNGLLLPIFITRLASDRLGNQVRGKKSKRSWSFKWKY